MRINRNSPNFLAKSLKKGMAKKLKEKTNFIQSEVHKHVEEIYTLEPVEIRSMLENKVIFNNFNDIPEYKSIQPNDDLLHLSMLRHNTITSKNSKTVCDTKKMMSMLEMLTGGSKIAPLRRRSNKKHINDIKGKLFKAINDEHEENVF